jgi:hypothetical protein
LPTTAWKRPACPAWKCRHAPGTGAAGGRLALAVQAAADCGDRQQRQNHRHANDRSHPARLEADKAFATEGNLNNDIGVPLTLLRLSAAHEVGVVELGMNHPGEIAYLAELSKPTVALVNNAQREHLEFMATVEAVARENGSVFQSLDAAGMAVFRPTTITPRSGVNSWARARC